MEKQPRHEFRTENSTLWSLLAIGLIVLLANASFSKSVREKILKRDGYKSVWSGKTDFLHVAHIDHNKRNPWYNHPSNGRTLTALEHLKDHINRAGRNGLTLEQNNWAIRMLMRLLGIES